MYIELKLKKKEDESEVKMVKYDEINTDDIFIKKKKMWFWFFFHTFETKIEL